MGWHGRSRACLVELHTGRTVHEYATTSQELPPIEAVFEELADAYAVATTAQIAVVTRCMRSAGFEYDPYGSTGTESASEEEKPNESLFTVIGLRSAADVPILAEPLDAGPSEPFSPPGGADPAAWHLALDGAEADRVEMTTPSGTTMGAPGSGCWFEGGQAIMGSEGEHYSQLNVLLIQARSESIGVAGTSAPVRDGVAAWRACAESRGAPGFDDPRSLLGRLGKAYSDGTTQDEVDRLAEIDLECKAETGLLGIANAALYDAQAAILDEHPGVIDEYRGLIDRMAERASEMLAR